jgi:hypothetical protein
MHSTLNPTCPMCGLRFGNQPHLDLHIREDHRVSPTRNGGSGSGGVRLPEPEADRSPDPHDPAATTSRASEKASARPGQPSRVGTALHRALRALRHAHPTG